MDTRKLIQDYVSKLNLSIRRNRARLPLTLLPELEDSFPGGLQMQVAIYEDDPAHPEDHFTLSWTGSELVIEGRGRRELAIGWSLRRSELERVSEDARELVQHASIPGLLRASA